MKTTNFLTLFALFFIFNPSAFAQQSLLSIDQFSIAVLEPGAAETPFIAAYIADPFEVRDDAWWSALNNELSIADQLYKHVSVDAMQNLIFFQKNHSAKVNQDDSVPTLLEIYNYHKSEEMRIMAVAALVGIGDIESLKTMEKLLYKQRTERVREYTIAALQDYKNN